MNQSNRICKLKGHDEYPIKHICTLLECAQPTRWSCSECINRGIHNHGNPNGLHVMKITDLLIRLKGESEKVREFYISNITKLEKANKELQRLENTIISSIQYIESQLAQFKRIIKLFQNSLAQDNFEMLDDNNINEILQINLQQNNTLLPPIDNFKQQLHQIELTLIEQNQNKNQNKNQSENIIVDKSKRKYEIQRIDAKLPYYGSSISNNEQYFAYGGEDKLLNVYDIQIKQKVKEIQLDCCLMFCQFTQDSSQLFVGLMDGFVYGFDAQNYFKQFFKKQIHNKKQIYKIITIQNEYLITCSSDRSIIKFDIKNNQQMLKLTCHNGDITGIDYNNQVDRIVSGSLDSSIILWDCNKKTYLKIKDSAHKAGIIQVQFINNSENILSLDSNGNLFKWKIDLIKNDLIKINEFNDANHIFQFQYIPQNQTFLIICNQYLKFLDQQGDTKYQIEHGCQIQSKFNCRQYDDLKYIQISAINAIFLAIRLD